MKRSDEKQLLLSEIIYCISSDAPLHWTTAGIRAIEECKLCAEYPPKRHYIFIYSDQFERYVWIKLKKSNREHLLKLINLRTIPIRKRNY